MYGKGGGAVINGRTEVKVEVVETEGEEGGGHCTHLACFLRNRKSSVEPPSPPVTQLAEFDDGHVSALLWQPLGQGQTSGCHVSVAAPSSFFIRFVVARKTALSTQVSGRALV